MSDKKNETQSTTDRPAEKAGGSHPGKKRKYIPAVTPRLKIALYLVFGLFALLAANSIYLVSITALESFTQKLYQDYFYIWMFLLHLILGLMIVIPFILFAAFHLRATFRRKNRAAVRVGYVLLAISILLLLSGIGLTRNIIDLKSPTMRMVVYWTHVLTPVAAIWLYCIHRLSGPPIKWKTGIRFAMATAVVIVGMVIFQAQDPRDFKTAGAPESADYFEPSLVRTDDGDFIHQDVLMNDKYCLDCHADIHADWSKSAHKFSSFNNPAYLASVAETRTERSIKSSRWCAGCHDPVPFLSGRFDDPNFDMLHDPTAHAGITCTVCHAISNVNSNRGNADYTIEEPIHYPFASSESPLLKWVNHQLVKAKPSFHKQMMLKPFHQTEEFCSTCHKVHLPAEVTDYKEFLRGQNHYDAYLLSGVSGHGLRSFYYPPEAQTNCNECHMPRKESGDFGALPNSLTGKFEVHDHMFPSANTAILWMKGEDEALKKHQEFMQGITRVDLFGIRDGNEITDQLTAPLRPEMKTLEPGGEYIIESLIRTLKLGHIFTQGTADSNEIWMDVTVIENAKYGPDGERTAGRVIGRSGGLDELKKVDPWSHFVNVFMLDRNGNRIDRRNAHDIFVPLYNHQIPPGAAQAVHYGLKVPEDIAGPVTVEIKLQYRKFDQTYMNHISRFHQEKNIGLRGTLLGDEYRNDLPITTLATDRVTFPVTGFEAGVENAPRDIPPWQRWNDYGIGLLLEGKGVDGQLRQAEEAFTKVEELNQFHGPINLARVYNREARLDEAVDAINRAEKFRGTEKYPDWTVRWLKGVVQQQQGFLDEAIENLTGAIEYRSAETVKRKFDFTRDYVVLNLLGETLFERGKQERGPKNRDARFEFFEKAKSRFMQVLKIDSENVTAHYVLTQILVLEKADLEKAISEQVAGDKADENLRELEQQIEFHRGEHLKYKADDSARQIAVPLATRKYPWARHASQGTVVYDLHREDAFELQTSGNKDASGTEKILPGH
ncbi:MAG: multiheme c-type cytochrome [Planctomycetota bacterium]|nr:multiheme c-type cytochrome [Planctomycetota bacterium]